MPFLQIDDIVKGWLNGQPVENLNKYRDISLDNLARTCAKILINRNNTKEEANNLLNALHEIIDEFKQRGLTKHASRYQATYLKLTDTPVPAVDNKDDFIKQVYDFMVQICANNKAELDEVQAIENKLVDNKSDNLIINQLTLFDFNLFTEDTVDSVKNNKLAYFTKYYFTNNIYGKHILGASEINLDGAVISAEEFAERLYWTNYSLWIVILQALMLANKVSTKYPDSKVLFNNSYNKYNATYQSSIYVDFPNRDEYTRQKLQVEYELREVMKLPIAQIKERQFNIIVNGETCSFGAYGPKGKEFINTFKTMK